nr:DUF1878 family protein [uncultured Bacillus sp.]
MDMDSILEKIRRLEYHQSLLLKMLQQSTDDFYKLIIEKSLGEEEVRRFQRNCDRLSMKLKEQKAEGFIYFHPLFKEFIMILPPGIQAEEVIKACIKQGLYLPLMMELKRYL